MNKIMIFGSIVAAFIVIAGIFGMFSCSDGDFKYLSEHPDLQFNLTDSEKGYYLPITVEGEDSAAQELRLYVRFDASETPPAHIKYHIKKLIRKYGYPRETGIYPTLQIYILRQREIINQCPSIGRATWAPLDNTEKSKGKIKNFKLTFDIKKDYQSIREKEIFTILSWGTGKGLIDQINTLIAKGVDLNAIDEDGRTIFMSAVFLENMEAVKLLIKKGADIKKRDKKGETPLMYSRQIDMAKFLIDKGEDINAFSKDGETALTLAARDYHITYLKFLLKNGAKINARYTTDGKTALWEAVKHRSLEAVKILIRQGAKVDGQLRNGKTPLFAAASDGNNDMVTLLLGKGAKINHQDSYGETALIEAVRENKINTVELLIKKGADVNLDNSRALSIASDRNPEIAKLLIKAGAKKIKPTKEQMIEKIKKTLSSDQ